MNIGRPVGSDSFGKVLIMLSRQEYLAVSLELPLAEQRVQVHGLITSRARAGTVDSFPLCIEWSFCVSSSRRSLCYGLR